MQGIPSVIKEIELMAGLMKASPVVIPERMPTTSLNLDLVKQMDREKREINFTQVISPINVIDFFFFMFSLFGFFYSGRVGME